MAKSNLLKSGFLILILILLGSQSCLKSKREGIPPDVLEVLNLSNIHKPKLTKFILECMLTKDSLVIDAGFFILSNLHKNYTAYYKLVDSTGNSYNINPEDYNNLRDIRAFIDSMENTYGKLSYVADSFSIDYASISSGFLNRDLNIAYDTWKNNKGWLDYDFTTFKKYILPYRVDNEEIKPFRDYLIGEFGQLIDTNKSFVENITYLNNHINSLITYDERYIKNQSVQTIKGILDNRKGNLADINILKVKIFRSLGIASVMDYTPFIADSSGWYAWTTIFSPNGDEMQLDIPDGRLKKLLDGRTAKVYRRTWFEDSTSLFNTKDIEENTPRFLGHVNYHDVTDRYLSTTNFPFFTKDTCKYIYLAVFNDGKWRPIDWVLNEDAYAQFTSIGQNVLYLPVKWENDEENCIGQPFTINNNEHIEFSPDSEFHEIILKSTSPLEKISSVRNYKLFYWDYEWIYLESIQSKAGLVIAKAPKNALMLLLDDDHLYDERVFIIDEGKQIFY